MTIPVPGIAQTAPGIAPISAGIVPVSGGIVPTTGAIVRPPDRLDWKGKLQFHAKRAYGPLALVGMAAYAGFLQEVNSPKEWGQGGSAYGERYASTLAWAGIHGVMAFGLDTALRQDPRYYRSDVTGFWRRAGHAVRATFVTRTDAGGETLATWRLGSDYGAAFVSNIWYPARLDKPRYGLQDGSISLGFDVLGNVGAEFWPDIRRTVFRRKP
jgi:hypothetical protein